MTSICLPVASEPQRLQAVPKPSRKVYAALGLATNCIEDAMSSLALGSPRCVSPFLKQADVHMVIQPEGNILADLLLQKLDV